MNGMASSGISSHPWDETYPTTPQENGRNTIRQKLICVKLSAEDKHSDKSLLLQKQNVQPNTIDNPPKESRIGGLCLPPSPIRQEEIVYFGYEALEQLGLRQTAPLQQVADTKTVAIHWVSLSTQERLIETAMLVYSRLRKIKKIIIISDDAEDDVAEHMARQLTLGLYFMSPGDMFEDDVAEDKARQSTFGLYGMSRGGMFEDDKFEFWWNLGRELRRVVRSQAFWEECNRWYALEQIPPIQGKPPCVPRICLGQLRPRR